MTSAVTLPQSAVDAARVSFEHNYGPGPSTMSDSDVWVDPLPAVSLETALTIMGASAPVPRPTGMLLGANKVGRGGAAAAFNNHHPWSMYLDGPVKQELVRLPRSLHIEFHRKMDEVVPKQKGKAYYQSLSPEKKQEVFRKFAERTKEFDAEHGTELYNALIKNGFPEP